MRDPVLKRNDGAGCREKCFGGDLRNNGRTLLGTILLKAVRRGMNHGNDDVAVNFEKTWIAGKNHCFGGKMRVDYHLISP